MPWIPRLRLRLRSTPALRPREPHRLFLPLALGLLLIGVSVSCMAHSRLIEEAWLEAVERSGYPGEQVHRPEVLPPAPGIGNDPLPRDEKNRPIVAQYFPLTHQVRIYARVALPMRRVLLREFLYAIYFDQLTSRPLDAEGLSMLEPARSWVEQALARAPVPER
jgi:hypothetical protein